MKKPKPPGRAALFALLLLASCASAPRTREAEAGGEFAALDPGALVYVTVDVPAARPILDLLSFADGDGMPGSALPPEMLDRTSSAVAAIYPPGSDRRFLLSAQGRFPAGRAGFSFALSPSWKKVPSPRGKRYWRSAREGLSVSLDSQSARVSDGDPYVVVGGVVPPESFGPLRRDAALAGWIEDAAAPINGFLEKIGIPLRIPAEKALFGVYALPAALPETGGGSPRYEAALRIETPSASQARGLIAMISLIRVFLDAGEQSEPGSPGALIGALLSNPPVQEDSALILRSAGMDSESIALLFNLFSVYSN
ncbi:MAG: hypothetical protein LBQ38_01585 [Spirochaetaceae bacterium]|nr:hypothetical protein [Spirochaetaceae bacterium]